MEDEEDFELDSNAVDEGSDGGEEEEQIELEAEALDSWSSFHERIDALLENEHCEKPVRKLDERRKNTLERVREQFRTAPKSIADRARSQKNQIEQQLELSSTRLGELMRFGDELVTNIRVANERRELDRLAFESSQQTKMAVNLHRESMQTMAKFSNIKSRWTELNEINEPMALWEQIEDQKKRIGEIMESKDEMIAACQREIDRMNAKYEYDCERQAADLSCLVERVDHQVETLKDAYKQHLQMLRHTIEDERQLFAITSVEKWRSFFDALNTNFEEKTDFLKTRERFYAAQTHLITESQEELTKSTRIRLEKECERLELELRRTRDNVLMNSEKLDYNYQVLQKRNDENVIINNQQKRRVARLHEAVVRMRHKLVSINQTGKQTIKRLSTDIYKLHASINDMESKAHATRLANKEKFDRMWEMNYTELMVLVNRVFEIDRILHEQQLAIPWQKVEVDTTDINPMPPRRHNNIMEQFRRRAGKPSKNRPIVKVKAHEPDVKELPIETVRLMHNLMRKLADRGGFLIEERLIKILEPYSEEDQCLVRIDNIFAALRIRRLRDVEQLTRIFMPFTYCPNCQPAGLSPQKCAEVFMHDRKHSRYLKLADVEHHEHYAEPDSMISIADGRKCDKHYLVMEPALILHALNKFTKEMHKRLYLTPVDPHVHEINYIQVTDETIRTFWRKFSACFPQSKRRLWKILEHGLNHYVDVLKLRQEYDAEVERLRLQNVELGHLLQKYLV
ncbi:dynein regulatory complex protein 1 homolog [Scaptodrosophila lebanonensis]|uniref:Dynein regulatory complex protein 1 homolog n=1 Tax=Drosophila lebanonensis TaxID=7225 RepID=A0A6J2TBW6_DROLE|nr:dynein regulatory complex protein 1 homolog [Scaptodrosophila lebanonensis]